MRSPENKTTGPNQTPEPPEEPVFHKTMEMSASLLAAALAKTPPKAELTTKPEKDDEALTTPVPPVYVPPVRPSAPRKVRQAEPVFHKTMEMSASLLAAALAKTPPKREVPTTPEMADDALIAGLFPTRSRAPRKGRRLVWLWIALGGAACVPVALTLIGALTSPPHVAGVPSGHLVYLDAEAPSEKTTTLRGLYVTGPGEASRLLVHENEPQDIDGGVREWVTQPTLSPDGTQLAFEKQLITLLEEKQAIQNQIWVMPLSGKSKTQPRLVMDLTKQKLKQIVGLAWDSDSSVLFLEDGVQYSVPTDAPDEPLQSPLDLHGLALTVTPDVSATRSPALTEAGSFAYTVQTPNGPQVLVQNQGTMVPGPSSGLFALSPTGDRIAFVPPDTQGLIRFYDIAHNQYGPDLPVRWGWSVFGNRHLTSLRWSPDGRQIAFTVSKPPVPEDEIFLVDIASGKTVQLPYRTGRAAWDWAK